MRRSTLLVLGVVGSILAATSDAHAHEGGGHQEIGPIGGALGQPPNVQLFDIAQAVVAVVGCLALILAVLNVSSSSLVRWGGAASGASGALIVAGSVLPMVLFVHFDIEAVSRVLAGSSPLLATTVHTLMAVGAIGLYLRLGAQSLLGSTGVTLVCLGTVILAILVMYGAFQNPQPSSGGLTIAADLALSGGTIGFLMLGIAVLRIRALGRWGALPLLLGLLMIPQPGFLMPGFLKYVPMDLLLLLDLASSPGWMLLGFLTVYSASYRPSAYIGAHPAKA